MSQDALFSIKTRGANCIFETSVSTEKRIRNRWSDRWTDSKERNVLARKSIYVMGRIRRKSERFHGRAERW